MTRIVVLEMEGDVTEHQKTWLGMLLEKVYLDSDHDFRDYRRGMVMTGR